MISLESVIPDAAATSVSMTGTHAVPEVTQNLDFSQTAANEKLRLLAREMGRQAARQHLARGNSVVEIAAVFAIVAMLMAALKWLLT